MPLTIPMPLSEVCDRYTIAALKSDKLPTPEQRTAAKAQVAHYALGMDFNSTELMLLVNELYEINEALWDTEGEIFRGETQDMPLEEVGRRALRVRNLNRTRCEIKNRIVALSGQGWHDEKADYAKGTPS